MVPATRAKDGDEGKYTQTKSDNGGKLTSSTSQQPLVVKSVHGEDAISRRKLRSGPGAKLFGRAGTDGLGDCVDRVIARTLSQRPPCPPML